MKFEIIKGNLFQELPNEDVYLAHCISADFGMGKGIVVEFNKYFDMKNKLTIKYKNYKWTTGDCILYDRVLNLITKPYYWDRPSYYTFKKAIDKMKEVVLENDIKTIAMPKIGCGLDRLEWSKVESILYNTFNDTDVYIKVYEL